MRLAALIALFLSACAYGEPVDRDVLCGLTDCEIQPASAGAAGANTDG